MNEIIATYVDFFSEIGLLGLLIVLAIPKLRRFIFNGNGNEKALKEIKDNHLHGIEKKLDKLIETTQKGNATSDKVLFILEREHGRD